MSPELLLILAHESSHKLHTGDIVEHDFDNGCDRNGQDHPRQSPQPAPEEKNEKNNQRAEP